MNELIKVEQKRIGQGEIQTVNARELHEFLESKQDFSTWVKKRIEQYDFVENQDFIKLHKKMDLSKTGQMSIDYHISIDMAKELSMVERNEKGKEARQYFIECERRLQEKVGTLSPMQMIARIALAIDKQDKEIASHNRRIEHVEEHINKKADIQLALPEVPEIAERLQLYRIVVSYCKNKNVSYRDAWNQLYTEFRYRYRLDIRIRARNRDMKKIEYAEKYGHIKKLIAIAVELFV